MTSRGAANACQSKCEIGGEMFLLRAIVDDSVDPAVVVTAYRTAKIEKYWGKLLHPVGAQRAVGLSKLRLPGWVLTSGSAAPLCGKASPFRGACTLANLLSAVWKAAPSRRR